MIFGLINWVIRKILTVIIIVLALVWYFFLRGKNFDYMGWMTNTYEWVKSSIHVQITPSDKTIQEMMTQEVQEGIDAWLIAQNLNQYGDPVGTVYAGGSPLFNEATGETTDRYVYIISKHPELLEVLKSIK